MNDFLLPPLQTTSALAAAPWETDAPWNVLHTPAATAADIFYCFRLILGRPPNREEWRGHAAYAGVDLDTVIKTYIGSLEFARRSVSMLDRRFDDSLALVSLDGFSLYVQNGDIAVGQCVKIQKVYEPHITSIMKNRVEKGMNIVDIGANIGYFTMLASRLVGSTGSVMAIEPNPANAKLIEASRRANRFENITIIQAAAGREIGMLVLNTAYSNGTTGLLADDLAALVASTTVPALKVDDIVAKDKPVHLIKIDIEGAEYNALIGASETIKRYRPIIISEFAPDMMPLVASISGPDYLNLLLSFGYALSVIEPDGSITACGRNIDRVMNAYLASGIDHVDLLMVPLEASWTR